MQFRDGTCAQGGPSSLAQRPDCDAPRHPPSQEAVGCVAPLGAVAVDWLDDGGNGGAHIAAAGHAHAVVGNAEEVGICKGGTAKQGVSPSGL